MRRGAPRAGFTLIEALVALVVLAVVMVAVQRGFVTARIGLDRARSTLAAEAVARSIVETELDRLAAFPGVRQGETDGLGWTVTTEPLALALQPGPPPRAGASAGSATGDTAAAAEQRATKEAALWRPMRVTVAVANGRSRPFTVETLHLAKAAE